MRVGAKPLINLLKPNFRKMFKASVSTTIINFFSIELKSDMTPKMPRLLTRHWCELMAPKTIGLSTAILSTDWPKINNHYRGRKGNGLAEFFMRVGAKLLINLSKPNLRKLFRASISTTILNFFSIELKSDITSKMPRPVRGFGASYCHQKQ